MQSGSHLLTILAIGLAVVLVVVRRLRSLLQTRRLRPELLWMRPAIFAAVSAVALYQSPPNALIDILILCVAAALGAVVGWRKAKMMTIGISPQTGELTVKGSPWAAAIVVGLLALRVLARSALSAEASAWHLNLGLILDTMIILVAAMQMTQAAEMYVRGRTMLREATV